MKTDIALDKLCEIVPIVNEMRPKIKEDDELKSISKKINEDGMDKFSFALAVLPIFLGKYRDNVYSILSILTEKSIDIIKEQEASVTFNELKNLILNEDFKSFFSQLSAIGE